MIPTVLGREHPESEGSEERRTADDTLRRFASPRSMLLLSLHSHQQTFYEKVTRKGGRHATRLFPYHRRPATASEKKVAVEDNS